MKDSIKLSYEGNSHYNALVTPQTRYSPLTPGVMEEKRISEELARTFVPIHPVEQLLSNAQLNKLLQKKTLQL